MKAKATQLEQPIRDNKLKFKIVYWDGNMTEFLCHGGGGVNADAIAVVFSSPPALEPTFLAAPFLRSATNWTTAQPGHR